MTFIRLSKAAEINPPGPKGAELMGQDRFDFVPMAAVRQDGYIDHVEQRDYAEVSKGYTAFKDNDILVAKITPCFENNKIALARTRTEYAFGSTEFHVIRCKPGKLEPKYLLHLLRTEPVRYEGERRMTGSAGQKRVPRSFFEELELPIPEDIDEQRRIAAILDKADAIRRKREQSLALADDLLKSAFLEMFGDLEHNDRNWPTEPLGELLSVKPQNGLYKPSNQYGTGTRILRIDGFYDGYLENEETFKRLAVSADEQAKYGLNNGDIVINRVNSRKYLGKSALVEGLSEATVFESNMMRFAVATKELEPRFLVDQLQTEYIKRQILTCSKDAVNQSSINQRDVESFRIRKPPIGLQNDYSRFVKATRVARHRQLTALLEASQVFASLSQRAFRGEL